MRLWTPQESWGGGEEVRGKAFQDMDLGEIPELRDTLEECNEDDVRETNASKQGPRDEEDVEEAGSENKLTSDAGRSAEYSGLLLPSFMTWPLP